MKISPLHVVMLGIGAILLYSGIKAYDPRDVIRWGLGGKKPEPFNKKEETELGRPQDKPPSLGGPEYPGDMGVPDPDREDDVPASYEV